MASKPTKYTSLEERYQEYKRKNTPAMQSAPTQGAAAVNVSALESRYQQYRANQGLPNSRLQRQEADYNALGLDFDWKEAEKALLSADSYFKGGATKKYQNPTEIMKQEQAVYGGIYAVKRLRDKYKAYGSVYGADPEIEKIDKHLSDLDKAYGDIMGNLSSLRKYYAQFGSEKAYNEYGYAQGLKGMSAEQVRQMIEKERLTPQMPAPQRAPGQYIPVVPQTPPGGGGGLPVPSSTRESAMAQLNQPIVMRDLSGMKAPESRRQAYDPKRMSPVSASPYSTPKAEELSERGQYYQKHYQNTFAEGMAQKTEQLQSKRAELEKKDAEYNAQIEAMDNRLAELALSNDFFAESEWVKLNGEKNALRRKHQGEVTDQISLIDQDIRELGLFTVKTAVLEKYGQYLNRPDYGKNKDYRNDKLTDIQLFEKHQEAKSKAGAGDHAGTLHTTFDAYDEKQPGFRYHYINNPEFRDQSKIIDNARNARNTGGLEGLDHLTDDERGVYNYLYNTGDVAQADAFIQEMRPILLERRASALAGTAASFAKDHPVLGSALALMGNMVSSIQAPINLANTLLGKTTDPFDPSRDMTRFSQAVQGQVSKDLSESELLNWNIPIINKNAGEFAYGTTMSILDFVTARLFSGGFGVDKAAKATKALTTMMFFGQQSGRELQRSLEQGMDPAKAVAYASAKGVIGALTERYSLENLLANPAAAGAFLLKNIAAEGSEELAETVSGALLDLLVMGDEGELRRQYLDLKRANTGMSDEEITRIVMTNFAQDALADTISGAISGGVMAAPASISTAAQSRTTGSQIISNQNAQALKAIGLTLDSQTKAYQMAQKFDPTKDRLNATGNLFRAVLESVGEKHSGALVDHMAASINTQLQERGETGDTFRIAQAIAKIYGGKKITREERSAITRSQYGTQLLNELFTTDRGKEAANQAEDAAAESRQQLDDLEAMPKGKVVPGDTGRAQNSIQEQLARAAESDAALMALEEHKRSLNQTKQNIASGALAKGAEQDAKAAERDADKAARLQRGIEVLQGKKQAIADKGQNATQAELAEAARLNKEIAALEELNRQAQATAQQAVETATPPTIEEIDAQIADIDAQIAKRTAEIQSGIEAKMMRDIKDLPPITPRELAVAAGALNLNKRTIKKMGALSIMSQEELDAALEEGQSLWEQGREERAQAAQTIRAKKLEPGKGVVEYDGGLTYEQMNPRQKQQADAVAAVAKALGLRVVLYQSTLNDAGEFVDANGKPASNGYYADGLIHIDINAGRMNKEDPGKEAFITTQGHELTHMLQEMSPELYRDYASFVLDQLADEASTLTLKKLTGRDISLDELVQRKMARSKHGEISMTTALDEIVADASEMMLRDAKLPELLKKQNPGLFAKIQGIIKDMIAKLRAAFTDLPQHYESAALMRKGPQGIISYTDELSKRWGLLVADAMAPAAKPAAPVATQKKAPVSAPVSKPNAQQGKAAKPAEARIEGEAGTAYTGDNQAVGYHFAAVDVDALVASNLENNLEPNPAFPQELQPRDRTRTALRQQVDEIAGKLNPALLGESADVGTGAPMVGPDMVVESGNGRVIAITRAMRQHKSQGYTAWLRENAERFGIAPAEVTGRSVLVRVRDTDVDRPAFVQKANEGHIAAYSDTESAEADAKKVTPAMLEVANMDSGEITSASNGSFVSAFISGVVPAAERGRMLDGKGALSRSGEARIRAALFQMAYGDAYLTEQMAESNDDTSKNILRSLTSIAPRLALINDAMRKGTLNDLPIGQEIAETYRLAQRVRREGVSIDQYLRQESMVQQETPAQRMLLEMFDEHRNAPLRMADALNTILDALEEQGDPNQVMMPGLETARPTVEGVVRDGAQQYRADSAAAGRKFSAREPVEVVGNLIAVHNLSEAQLQESVRLGGFAMPSIAVLKSGTEHSRYGDISVVFGKETIDPMRDRRNRVYGGDAYTPSFPTIHYMVDENATDAIRKTVKSLLGDIHKEFNLPLSDDAIERAVNDNRGDFASAYQREPGMIGAYLKSIGERFLPIYTEPDFATFSGFNNATIKHLVDELGSRLETLKHFKYSQMDEVEPVIRKIVRDYEYQEWGSTLPKKAWERYAKEKFGFAKVDNIINGAVKYKNNKGELKFDRYETGKMLVGRLEEGNHDEGYKAWVNKLFKSAIKKAGIRNNADIFTSSGNRRGFDATHWALTLENILRAMKSENSKGADMFAGSNIFGVATKNYKSIDDIRKDAERLRKQDDSEYKAKKQEYQDRLIKLATEIAPKSEQNQFIAIDRGAELLTDAARKGTKAGMQRVLNEHSDYYAIKSDTAERLYNLVQDIMRMPTEYFEAKPERAVGLKEVRAVVHPDTISSELAGWMDRNGVRHYGYESGNEQDRLDKLNSLQDVRFSERDSAYLSAVEAGDMDTAQKMVDAAAAESGLEILDDSASAAYRVRRTPPPKNTIKKAYKLFATKSKQPGQLFPLFVGATEAIPKGVWLDAIAGQTAPNSKTGKVQVKSKLGPLAYRPGWHAGDIPLATHIGVKDADGNVYARRATEVWAEVELAADVDYQPQASASKTRDLREMPVDGAYRFKTNPNMTGEWIISGSMKINRVLSQDEVNVILAEKGAKIMPWENGNLVLENLGLTADEAINRYKLADPVTYDDAGNIIPLSQRFNAQSNDIRYSERGGGLIIKAIDEAGYDPKLIADNIKDVANMGPVSVMTGNDIRYSLKDGEQLVQSQVEDSFTYNTHRYIVNGKAVGEASVMVSDEGAYVERIDIDPPYRNKGHGSRFLSSLKSRYGEVYAAPDNPDSKRLFERIGRDVSAEQWAVDQGHGVYRFSERELGITELSQDSKNNISLRGGIIVSNRQELVNHVEQALLAESRNTQKNLYIGAITADTKEIIEHDAGKPVFSKDLEYAFSVSYDDIRHIEKHFSDVDDIVDTVLKVYSMFRNHDFVEALSGQKNRDKTRLHIKKTFPDADYLTVSIVGNQRRAVDLVTVYITKMNIAKDGQSVPPAAIIVPDSSQRGSSASNQSIPLNDQDSQAKMNDNDIRYQERDADILSTRAILASAFDTIARTDGERRNLREYKNLIGAVNRMENEARLLREQNTAERRKKGDADKALIEKNKARIAEIDERVTQADKRLLRIQNAAPLKNLVKREGLRMQAEARDAERAKGRARLSKYKDKQAIADSRARIQDISRKLGAYIVTPAKGKSVPQAIRSVVGNFLLSINEQSVSSLRNQDRVTKADRDFYERLNELAAKLDKAKTSGKDDDVDGMYAAFGGWLDLPDGFTEGLRDMASLVGNLLAQSQGEYVLNAMDLEQTRDLERTMVTLDKAIRQMNDFLTKQDFSDVTGSAQDAIKENMSYRARHNRTGKIDGFMNWDNTLPIYAFKRMGKAARSIFKSLQAGMDRLANNAHQVIEFSKKTFTGAEAREWSNQLHTFDIGGEQVTMRTVDIMSLYNLYKREQARGHILGEGIRVKDFTLKRKRYSDAGHTLNANDVMRVIAALTPRQMEVADALQAFVNDVGSKWGNQVSMARFGVNMFEETDYWTIETDSLHREADMGGERGNPLYRLLNLGMTKQLTKGANNRLLIGSVFDTFANHMSDMSQYNALALPVLDAVKWYNYKESTKDRTGRKETNSVRDALRNAFGDSAPKYIAGLLRDVNGARVAGARAEGRMLNLLHRFNRQAVAANLRVALLQPTAIARAMKILGTGQILKGALTNVAHIKENIKEMEQYSGIAKWKQLGFYDVNVSRSLQEMIKRDADVMDRAVETAMSLPQFMDRVTWSAIWSSAKSQVEAGNRNLQRGTPEYFKAVADLFNEVIYKTQVVDSMLTRSAYMRENTFGAKWTSSFMSEPTMSYNMLADTVHSFNDDLASGRTRGEAWKRHGSMIVKTVEAYAANVLLVTIVESIMGAWRDDDEYQTFMEKISGQFRGALLDNLNPFNLPILSSVFEYAKRIYGKMTGTDVWGFESTNPITAPLAYIEDAVEAFNKRSTAGKSGYTDYGIAYKALQAVSSFTGVPFASMTREAISLWNNTAGLAYPEMRVVKYEGGKQDAYQSLYDSIVDADAKREKQLRDLLSINGADDKGLYAGLRDIVRDELKAGNITEQEALDILQAEEGSPGRSDVYWLVQKWEAQAGAEPGEDVSFTRTDRMAQAIRTGNGYDAAVKELTTYGMKPETVVNETRAIIRAFFMDGSMDRATAQRRLNDLAPYEKPSDTFKTLERWTFERAHGTGAEYGVMDKFYAAVETGKDLRAVITEYLSGTSYGYDKKTLAAQITEYFKPKYLELYKTDRNAAFRLMGYLLNAYSLLGYSRDMKTKDIREWTKSSKK